MSAREMGLACITSALLLVVVACGGTVWTLDGGWADDGIGSGPGTDSVKTSGVEPGAATAGASVELSTSQLGLIGIDTVGTRAFVLERTIVGAFDFDQDKQLQIFTPYQGRLIALNAQLGDRVKKGQILFTVDSADLLQEESTLLQAAGVDELTRAALLRARRLLPAGGGAQKDLDQAVSDQQTAEGNLKAARDALNIYGKTDADIDLIIKDRRIDSTLVVRSPIDGVITARNGSPGLLVQPGSAPAPYAVANNATVWLNGSASEIDIREFRVGQEIEAHIVGIPDRVYRGTVSVLGPTVDPATRRLTVRSEIANPDDLIKPGMFATITVKLSKPRSALALPESGVVREGDGTMTAWVTTDRHRFTQRTVKIGLQQNGYDEILSGLHAGELAVTDGAVFVSNVLNAPPSD